MERILKNSISFADKFAIIDDKGNSITYRELVKEAGIIKQYIKEKSIIFILCDHNIETIEFVYKVLYSNRIPLLLSNKISKELLEHLLDIYEPQYIYCKKEYEYSNRFHSIVEFGDYMLLRTNNVLYPIHPELALLMSTSGTTGSTKLVKLSYENLYDNVEHMCERINLKSEQKGISPLPINHIYGLAFCLWNWQRGATLLISEESIISNKFNDFYIREKANIFAATPSIYRMMQKIQFWDSDKLAYLHIAMSGGEQMTKEEQYNLVSMLGNKFWISYGQTECSCIISTTNFDKDNIKFRSVGKALDNINIDINDKNGEIIVKSKSVCMGYAHNIIQLSEGDVNQGTIFTGDRGYMDEDGYIYLEGRLARDIKILGKRVCLDDIEEYLKSKFVDIEFACIGLDNCVVVFYNRIEENIEKRTSDLLRENMNIPYKFIFCMYLEQFPKSDTNKIGYTELENLWNKRDNLQGKYIF